MALMTDVQVAAFFGKRAGGLAGNTCKTLAQAGIAPICVTSSFAQNTGERESTTGEVRPLPVLDDITDLPAAIAAKEEVQYSPRMDGDELVHRGELGGVSSDSEYIFVDLERFRIGEKFVRISCRNTRHEFTRYAGGWSYVRAEDPNRPVMPCTRPRRRQG